MPGALVADEAASSLTDRGYSLPSLDSAPGGGQVAPAQDDTFNQHPAKPKFEEQFVTELTKGCPKIFSQVGNELPAGASRLDKPEFIRRIA